MGESVHIKYLFTNDKDVLWGLTINTVGYQNIVANTPYPPQNHPTRYLFSIEKGRVLDEYQLLYITNGKGRFVSTSSKEIELTEGRMFLLFPGEWHNYQPDKSTGWTEYWIGFKGINIDNRIDSGFFTRQNPVFNVGVREEIVQLYNRAIVVAQEQKYGFQPMLAGIVNHLLGYAYSYDKQASFDDEKISNQINKAKILIIENIRSAVNPQDIASELNMSYSWFRRIFKKYTGFSPSAYITEIKIQKSKELLTNTNLTSREIAYEMGFESPDYFSTIFKKKANMTPIQYREFTQGKNIKSPYLPNQ